MIHDLIPWRTLTRTGIPALKVTRRQIVLGEVIVPVGETLDPELLPLQIRRERLRQFYEQRLLEPVSAPKDSRQFYREQLARAQGQEVPITPIQPVASQIVADLPAIEVEVEAAKRRPKGAK
jgi:hypothetical protein